MRHRMRLLAAAVGVAAAALPAALANASPETDYLSGLNGIGLVVYDTSAALATGYAICEAFNYTTGDVVAYNLYTTTSFTDVPDIQTAQEWVVVAGLTLCPWHYHPERGVAT